jgi:hypothetical protein
MSVNFKNGFRALGHEHGCSNRVMLMKHSLKSRFCSLNNKGAIAALALPKAVASTVVAGPMNSAAIIADRFVSVFKTLGNPKASVARKIFKVVLLPVKVAFSVVGAGVNLLFTPIHFLGYTVQALAMMSSNRRKVAAEKASKDRTKLLNKMN